MTGKATNTFSNDLSEIFVGGFGVIEQEVDQVLFLDNLIDSLVTLGDDFLKGVQKEILEVLLVV